MHLLLSPGAHSSLLRRRVRSVALALWLSGSALADRDLNTDRPSKTDGPFTLDAARTQCEFELFSRAFDDSEGVETRAVGVGTVFVRHALTSAMELQLGWQSYAEVRTRSSGGSEERLSGFGDTFLRAKYNAWGNDGGETAFGLIPSVKFPTAQDGLGNDHVEFALSVPFTWNLPAGWQLGVSVKGAGVHDEFDDDGYRASWEYSALVSRSLTERVSGFAEVWSGHLAGDSAPDPVTVGVGLGWKLNANAQIDGGATFALNETADDMVWFVGYSIRLP